MSTYSTQFFKGALPAGTTVLATVPASSVFVIRDIELYAGTSSSIQVALAVGVSGLPVGYIYFVNPIAPGDWKQWSGRAVLEAGDQLLAVAAAAGVDALVSGYNLVN